MKRYFLMVLVLCLAACGVPATRTAAPTLQAINVRYPAALQPWADKLGNCASNISQIALYYTQSSSMETNLATNDVVLDLGQPQISNSSYLSQMGWEQIVVIVNQSNALLQLSVEGLQQIFAGQSTTWNESSGQPIRVWVLPATDPIRIIFDESVLQNQPLASEAMLAPDPTTELEAIAQDPDAIGYLPGSIVKTADASFTSKVKAIEIDPSLEETLRQPVIAITQSEPSGFLRQLLVCLETNNP